MNEDTKCKTHPDAPHGFVRDASITEDRYVCECEYWEPPKEDIVFTKDELKHMLEEEWRNGYRVGRLDEGLLHKEQDCYKYAARLAINLWERHYKDQAPEWKPFDNLAGVLTQIDNMASGLVKAQPEQEPSKQFHEWACAEHQKIVAESANSTTSVVESKALAQPEQEPVGTYGQVAERMYELMRGTIQQMEVYEHFKNIPLYTAPPKREWVGLTEEEIDLYALDIGVTANKAPAWLVVYAKDIEAKLKDKNT